MNYTGNKNIPGVLQKIINEIPLHSEYWELFAGSAAIGKALPAGTVKHFCELDLLQLEKLTVGAKEKEYYHSFNVIA